MSLPFWKRRANHLNFFIRRIIFATVYVKPLNTPLSGGLQFGCIQTACVYPSPFSLLSSDSGRHLQNITNKFLCGCSWWCLGLTIRHLADDRHSINIPAWERLNVQIDPTQIVRNS
jgi:hypothetical protein